MTIQEIKKAKSLVLQLLSKKELKSVLDKLGELAKKTFDSALIDSHYNLMISYKSLLHYTVEGINDPERQSVYQQIVVDLYRLSDKIFLILNTKYSSSPFYETKRKSDSNPVSILEALSEIKKDFEDRELMEKEASGYSEETKSNFDKIFNTLLTQPQIYKEHSELEEVFIENDALWTQQCTFVTAITINLLHTFNIDALLFLLKLRIHPNLEIKQRVNVGLLLLLYKYDYRLENYKSIIEEIKKWQIEESDSILQGIIIQLVRSQETEDLARKFSDEILPEMARVHPNLRDRLDLDNIISDSLQEGKNPDWEDIFSDSPELLSKLEEFSKLQMEGADLFISTFRMLKDFPFFNKMSNWFLPFSNPNPEVSEILKNDNDFIKETNFIENIAEAGLLCNSDKFSLILSIPMMPQSQKEMMGQIFLADLESAKEVEKSEELIDPDKEALSISNQYIQDLYRFFKIHPQKASMDDPFSWKLDFYNKQFIKHLFPNNNILTTLGDYLFNKNRFEEAVDILEIILSKDNNETNVQLLQKIAFCYQQQNDYESALKYYLKADLIETDKVWNIKKVAHCYLHLNNSEEALKYYQRAEELDPENIHTQVSIAHCFFEMNEFEEALKYYFKVEYLDPKNQRVWRPIVWCTFMMGKFDQSKKYCEKLLESNPTQNDFLNMGHIIWSEGNRQEALTWYQKSVKHKDSSLEKFLEAFYNDKEALISHNIDIDDIPIMLDQLRYYLEG